MTPEIAPRKALAIAALVVGLLSICIPILGALAAITLGILALVKRNQGGKGMAIAGIVLGCINFFLSPALVLTVIVDAQRATEKTICLSNLKQMVLSARLFEQSKGRLPRDLDELVGAGAIKAQCLDCRSSQGLRQDYVMIGYPKDPPASQLWIYCRDLRAHHKGVPCAFTDGSASLLSPEDLAEAMLQAAEASRVR